MNTLEQTLKNSGLLSDQSVGLLVSHWQKSKQLDPKEALLDFNQRDSNLYFVEEGCVRLMVSDRNGNDINLGFAYENTLVTCFQAFVEDRPSLLRIEAITRSRLIRISKGNLMALIDQNPDIAKWYQSMLEITLSGHIQRQVELLTLTPAERYKVFLERSGHLVNRVPLKYIASYLMMKPETLSRIRSKLS